jgi:hypothetical protein
MRALAEAHERCRTQLCCNLTASGTCFRQPACAIHARPSCADASRGLAPSPIHHCFVSWLELWIAFQGEVRVAKFSAKTCVVHDAVGQQLHVMGRFTPCR